MTETASVVSIAMYPFEPLRSAIGSLWASVTRHLEWGPSTLDWEELPPDVWRHPDLFLAQACGWPLVNQLVDEVAVVGTFAYDVPGAADGRYQSVLISRAVSLAEVRRLPNVVAAANAPDSLSGWISLQRVWDGVAPAMVKTGSHLESVRAIADGRADVASIDAVTWSLISTLEPLMVSGLSVVGNGPTVPCLPLVVPLLLSDRVDDLRAAFTAAVADPAMADACAALRISAFVPLDLDDYLPLLSLLPTT